MSNLTTCGPYCDRQHTGSEPHNRRRHTRDVLEDVFNERSHQIATGWTADHDDRHNTHTLVQLADTYAHKEGDNGPGFYDRRRLVQAAALLVAAIEAWDRRPAGAS